MGGIKYLLLIILMLLFAASPAEAISDEEGDSATRTLSDYIQKYVDIPKGGTDWKVFGMTKEIEVKGRDAEGMDYEYKRPEFSDAVKALDGKTVTVKGFMFPLEGNEAQRLFLLGPFPVSCPFHYHVGSSLVIEVHTDAGNPIKFSYDPVTVTGRLQLVDKDPEYSVFYRILDARMKN